MLATTRITEMSVTRLIENGDIVKKVKVARLCVPVLVSFHDEVTLEFIELNREQMFGSDVDLYAWWLPNVGVDLYNAQYVLYFRLLYCIAWDCTLQ